MRHKSGIPVLLDESISNLMEVINAIGMDATDMINVKLSKSGGIHLAFILLDVPLAAGINAIVRYMLESKLGIVPH